MTRSRSIKKQILVWIDDAKDEGTIAPKFSPIDLPEEGVPSRVWTLFKHVDKDNKPELPFVPTHHENAFLEDRVHDWDVRNDQFHYYTRVTAKGCWLLFEYRD